MAEAVWPFRQHFITPMAAVAGAVAEEMLAALTQGRDLAKAYVNDGGDIALHLAPGERFSIGIVAELAAPAIAGRAEIAASDAVRGIATSGQGGRSFSLGIADAVTVLARRAAEADAAATLIANAVDLDHPAIQRRPASSLDPDSDLGELPGDRRRRRSFARRDRRRARYRCGPCDGIWPGWTYPGGDAAIARRP